LICQEFESHQRLRVMFPCEGLYPHL